MSIPIRQTLAMTPQGKPGLPLKDDELARYLRENCNREIDKAREADHLLRDALYHDGGIAEVEKRVDRLFESPQVRDRIKRRLSIARYSNATKLIVGEMNTIYSEPAVRTVGGGEGNQAKYDLLLEQMWFDEEMEHVAEMFCLHRAIIAAPRVRLTSADFATGEVDNVAVSIAFGSPDLVLDVHSAATARAVMAPNDNTLVVAWLTRCQSRAQRDAYKTEPAWLLTSDFEWEFLDKDFRPIPGTHQPHGLGSNPWIPLTTSSKATPDFWPGEDGEDLVAAHVAGLIVEALLVKETNAAARVPVAQGDTSAMPRNQDLDSTGAIQAPEGVSITSIEIGTDINVFLSAADHIIQRAGNNYGLSMEVLKHEGATSADARELMLAPVKLRRRKMVKRFHRFERELAGKLAALTSKMAATLTFEFVDWTIDFGEPQAVLSHKEKLEIFQSERQMGLDSTYRFYQRQNPDLTDAQAKAAVLLNIEDETDRNEAMRPLQEMSGSLGAPVPDAGTDNTQKAKPPQSADDPFAWVKGFGKKGPPGAN